MSWSELCFNYVILIGENFYLPHFLCRRDSWRTEEEDADHERRTAVNKRHSATIKGEHV